MPEYESRTRFPPDRDLRSFGQHVAGIDTYCGAGHTLSMSQWPAEGTKKEGPGTRGQFLGHSEVPDKVTTEM